MVKIAFFVFLSCLIYVGNRTLQLKQSWLVFIPFWGLCRQLGFYAGKTETSQKWLGRLGAAFGLFYLILTTFAIWSILILYDNPQDYLEMIFFLNRYYGLLLPIVIVIFVGGFSLCLLGLYRFLCFFQGPHTKGLATLVLIVAVLNLVLHYFSIHLAYVALWLLLSVYWTTREKEGKRFIVIKDGSKK
ncbi:hypothetical protein AB1I63_03545 [Streptococcus pneumoniae]